MGFYDSVKQDVHEEHTPETDDDSEEDSKHMPFDSLINEAKDDAETKEKNGRGDNTQIEVLRDGKLEKGESQQAQTAQGAGQSQPQQPQAQQAPQQNAQPAASDHNTEPADGQARSGAADTVRSAVNDGAQRPAPDQSQTPNTAQAPDNTGADGEVVETLKRLEQQNDEMLDVLRGIKRALER